MAPNRDLGHAPQSAACPAHLSPDETRRATAPIEKLLGIVEQYKLNDSRWLNGYPPELSNWLYTRQFEKAPLMHRPKKTFIGKTEPSVPILAP